MGIYLYKASTSTGQIIEDTINATDSRAAQQELINQGLKVVWIKKGKKKSPSKAGGRVPLIEKANLCRYLATMLSAGLSLPEAIDVFAHDTSNKKLKDILSTAYSQLQQGKNLSTALEQYPKVFDPIIISLIRAGELSGTLTQSLEYLAKFLYDEYKLKQKVKSALMYPVIILLAMGGVGFILLFFVMPKMAPIFLSLKVSLPFYTQIILRFGMFVNQYALFVIPASFILSILFLFALMTPPGRKLVLFTVSLIPAIKRLLNYLDLSRFCRILGTLLSSGVPINQAMQIVTDSLSQAKYKKAVSPFHLELQKGVSLAELMRGHPKLFPQITVRMIAAGEKTGSIETMLTDSASYYDNEIEDILNNFANIIEPILLLLVGLGVGVMVVSVIGPIYSLVGGLQGVN